MINWCTMPNDVECISNFGCCVCTCTSPCWVSIRSSFLVHLSDLCNSKRCLVKGLNRFTLLVMVKDEDIFINLFPICRTAGTVLKFELFLRDFDLCWQLPDGVIIAIKNQNSYSNCICSHALKSCCFSFHLARMVEDGMNPSLERGSKKEL